MSKHAKTKRRATYEDIIALPEHLIGELVNGELIVSPRPSGLHGGISSDLGVFLGPFSTWNSRPGGWWIIDEPELHLGEDVLVPDLAGWRRERMPVRYREPFATLAPDWVCEVLSPSTRRVDRNLKLPLYAREGVGHVWLIDPQPRTLEVLGREGSGWRSLATFAGNGRIRAEPFEAVELELGALWLQESYGAPSSAP